MNAPRKQFKRTATALAVAVMGAGLLAGCASYDPYHYGGSGTYYGKSYAHDDYGYGYPGYGYYDYGYPYSGHYTTYSYYRYGYSPYYYGGHYRGRGHHGHGGHPVRYPDTRPRDDHHDERAVDEVRRITPTRPTVARDGGIREWPLRPPVEKRNSVTTRSQDDPARHALSIRSRTPGDVRGRDTSGRGATPASSPNDSARRALSDHGRSTPSPTSRTTSRPSVGPSRPPRGRSSDGIDSPAKRELRRR